MKKGFTLIELLAVIVILAIIALIATPIIINIISDTKGSASLRSADFYLDAVEFSIANSTLDNRSIKDGTYPIMSDGNICLGALNNNTCDKEVLAVEVKGETPNGGEVTITSGEIEVSLLTYKNATIVKNVSGELINITNSMGQGTLAHRIIKENSGTDNVKTLSSEYYLNDEFDGIYLEEGYSYTFGTTFSKKWSTSVAYVL